MIMVAVSIVALFAFAVLAIDLSMIMLAKTQLQNAADAAALAGALALGQHEGDQTIAASEAELIAGLNMAVQDQQRPVLIDAGDISFPEDYKITVATHRTVATNDPVTLHFMSVVDPNIGNQGEMTARATAAVYPVGGTDCLKPWCFPDQWDDADYDSAYDAGEFYDPNVTGYKVPDDIGTEITLKLRNASHSPRMGWYYAIDFAPINTGDPVETGGDPYREWIGYCEPYMVSVGDLVQIEPGNMVGPTQQGVQMIIDRDPAAQWDEATGTVVNSAYPTSPRVIKAAVFDPTLGMQTDVNGRDYLTVVKIVAVFLESHDGSDVIGRFMKTASGGEPCPDCPVGFLFTPVLIE